MAARGETVTYRELDERSNRLAHLWHERGLRPGDHVAILLRERPALVRRGVGGAAIRPVLHAGQLAPHRTGGGLHRRRLRGSLGGRRRTPSPTKVADLDVEIPLVLDGDIDGLGALRGRGGRTSPPRPRRGARGRRDVLLIGHDRPTQGHPLPAPRSHRARRAPDPHVQEPDRQRPRRRLPLARADVPHGPGGHVLAGPSHGRHHRGDGAVGSRGLPRRHRALPRDERAVRADDVRPPAEAPRRGARPLRRLHRCGSSPTPPRRARSR